MTLAGRDFQTDILSYLYNFMDMMRTNTMCTGYQLAMAFGTCLVFMLSLSVCLHAQPSQKLRVLVLTDIEADPDDAQSMVRFLTYSNQWEVEGFRRLRLDCESIGEKRRPDSLGYGLGRSQYTGSGFIGIQKKQVACRSQETLS